MAQAVSVRRDGDTFQARLFWLHAARLLDPESAVVRVGFETGPKCFDDIWVEYDPRRSAIDQYGAPLLREHIQCKWHVSPGTYGYAHVVDPEFINANSRSLLQRALEAQLAHAPTGIGVRFKLLTNWRIERADPLREMIGTRSGAVRLERFYDSTTDNSRAGKIRKAWREHLGIDDDGLRLLARTLAFGEAVDTLDGLRDHLDVLFRCVGLSRVAASLSAFPYDDTIFQWMAQGRVEFDRNSFRSICDREGLLGQGAEQPRVYGVKSFEHAIDRLEERCTQVLDLVPAFDERFIRTDDDWASSLYPALKLFLLAAARDQERLQLVLDAHATLAFAAGSVLDIKCGRKVALEQRTVGRRIWTADDVVADPAWPALVSEVIELDTARADVAVAVGITHDVAADVATYVSKSLPSVGRILNVKPESGAGAQTVVCGRHAFDLAAAIAKVAQSYSRDRNTLHLFVAAPNVLTFFLGQRRPLLGRVRLYEFDFEGGKDRSYVPSLTLPLH